MKLVKTLLFLTLLLVLPTGTIEAAQSNHSITIEVDGEVLQASKQAFYLEATVMVPFRPIFEAMGYGVSWDQKNQTLRAETNLHSVEMTVDAKVAYVNGEASNVVQPAVLRSGATYVPLRFVAEASGNQVFWDNVAKRASIHIVPKRFDAVGTLEFPSEILTVSDLPIELYEVKVTNGEKDYHLVSRSITDKNGSFRFSGLFEHKAYALIPDVELPEKYRNTPYEFSYSTVPEHIVVKPFPRQGAIMLKEPNGEPLPLDSYRLLVYGNTGLIEPIKEFDRYELEGMKTGESYTAMITLLGETDGKYAQPETVKFTFDPSKPFLKTVHVAEKGAVKLSGIVRDSEGRPVGGAMVRVTGVSDPGFYDDVTTDKTGTYHLYGLEEGKQYYVTASNLKAVPFTEDSLMESEVLEFAYRGESTLSKELILPNIQLLVTVKGPSSSDPARYTYDIRKSNGELGGRLISHYDGTLALWDLERGGSYRLEIKPASAGIAGEAVSKTFTYEGEFETISFP